MATKDRQASTLALAHALSAAERGLAVIPLSRTKLPALRSPHRPPHSSAPTPPLSLPSSPSPSPPPCHGECGRFGHGVYDASTDPRRIRELFAAAPWATGYGIACGVHPHHLIGVDLDTKSGTDSSAALRELALRHLFTIPETVVVLTPSGGRHLWLTGPPDVAVPNSASRLAPGIDIRGAGGYLVGPGSRTDHGVYTAAPGTSHLHPAPCPPALLRLLLPPPRTDSSRTPGGASRTPGGGAFTTPGGAQGSGHGLVHFVLTAQEGQRNTRLFWAACRAYENGLGPELANALVEVAVRTGLTEREARSTIASAARMARGGR
ncbi:bifunctional DNA primase/polymerase [Streptomyces caniscabiei]|uniref:bifunctional DNA primase/polymerase n=2 Tax=Streptomyces caniscabiei TaxID=2746961 RepID=UPI0029A8903E|nr:bifunctional DNA primase/polymerase [Streptomyces caniscabiei]MDX2601644.1 bifunctional DNA primase/polymerase [Streptomyces caniscabiei]MDX2737079.1 bifunctional DNA primase/polymerase [Streptomyces caniscabiei]